MRREEEGREAGEGKRRNEKRREEKRRGEERGPSVQPEGTSMLGDPERRKREEVRLKRSGR